MNRRSCFRLVAGLAFFSLFAVAAAETVPPAVAAQWADLPEYLALMEGKPNFKSPPRLISGAPPRNPDFLAPGSKVTVMVTIAIDERGEVVAARVAKSDDPRVDPIAVETIQRWKFAPAQGETGPVKCVAKQPLHFNGPPQGDQNKVSATIGQFRYDVRGLSLNAPVQLAGPIVPSIKAGRVIITSAIDDTGAELALPVNPKASLMRTAVGPEELTPKLSLNISLKKPAPTATRLKTLTGSTELVIPALDPAATVHLDQLPAKLGQPVQSPELAAAGVTIIVLDRIRLARSFADANDPSGARAFLVSPAAANIPGWKHPIDPWKMTHSDVAIAIHDPDGHLAGLEFQSLHGNALPYNHNGWSHF